MRVFAAIAGFIILILVLVDAFNTIILARRTRHVFRIARLYYSLTWSPVVAIARRIKASRAREAFLGIYGPLSLLLLFGLWAVALIFAFALLQWAVRMQPASLSGSFGNILYLSAATLFTLNTGDPVNSASKAIAVIQGGLGFSFLGLVVGYLPVFYQSFSERELSISLMDARAGSPPSAGALLESAPFSADKLERELAGWETWAAQILENQMSFPMLAYFRSQHSNQSWLTALVAMVDCAAIVSLCSSGDLQRQASLTLAMGRHSLVDIAIVFGLEKTSIPGYEHENRQTAKGVAEIQKILRSSPGRFNAELCTEENLRSYRKLYEPAAAALGRHFLMALPSWTADESVLNWRAAITGRQETPFGVSDPFAETTRKE